MLGVQTIAPKPGTLNWNPTGRVLVSTPVILACSCQGLGFRGSGFNRSSVGLTRLWRVQGSRHCFWRFVGLKLLALGFRGFGF